MSLELNQWIGINQLVPLSIETWLGNSNWHNRHGLNKWLREAILYEVNRIGQERESKRAQTNKEMEMKEAEGKGKLNFPGSGMNIQQYMR